MMATPIPATIPDALGSRPAPCLGLCPGVGDPLVCQRCPQLAIGAQQLLDPG